MTGTADTQEDKFLGLALVGPVLESKQCGVFVKPYIPYASFHMEGTSPAEVDLEYSLYSVELGITQVNT